MGFIAYDPLLIFHFNTTVGIFKPSMRDKYRDSDMVKLSPSELRTYNHRAYPRIEPDTMEMQWWVERS